MPAKLPKFSYPVPSNKNGQAFSSMEDLLSKLSGESSGHYLVGSQGMWHGGIHITDATIPWCALSTDSEAEREYCREPYKGEQFIRCMAEGEIVAWRVCKDYESTAITWRDEKLQFSTSFVLVKHYVQPGETQESGLTFYTLYMNLAPFDAYVKPGNRLDRKTSGSWRYYANAEDTQAGRVAGTLVEDTSVTLSDNIITRASDRRQFTEVTLSVETKNAAEVTLAAGTKIWMVSDQGSLKTASSVPVPLWWTKCSPAYGIQHPGVLNCTSRTDWSFYLSREDVLQKKSAGKLTAGFPLTYEPDNAAQQVIRQGKEKTDTPNTFSLCTLGRDVGTLKKGERVWVVSDGDSLTPSAAASGTQPVFGAVVIPTTPISVNAGDSIGHMGFYQLPEENGKRSRYQVHIECLSMDDKLPAFLTNPEHAGVDSPVFLKYPEDAVLYAKNAEGVMAATDRKTRAPGILTLSGVPTLKTGEEVTHYQIHPEGGWLAAASIQKVSQHALSELGFVTLEKTPESFDLIDGVKHPDNVVKGILEQMYKAAQNETRTSHALNEYNYKRLLERIDSNQDGHYSEGEYIRAIHNVSYRDALYRIIVKHGSEWYYGKDDPLWKNYLDTLTKDAPLWKTYTETFIDKMAWMKQVPGMVPEPWHMHPVVFLEALNIKNACACNRDITLEELKNVSNGISDNNARKYLSPLNEAFNKYGISTCLAKAHLITQLLHESGRFGTTKEYKGENAAYSPWYGRGLIQITLEANYIAYGKYANEDVTSSDVNRNKLLNIPHSVESALWFFKVHTSCYEYSLVDDFNKLSHTINGGFIGYNDRLDLINSSVKALHAEHLLKLNSGGQYLFSESKVYNIKRGALAWGLWHDPGTNKEGMNKNKALALEGYLRFKEILSSSSFTDNELKRHWYGIKVSELEVYVNNRIAQLGV